MGDIKIEPLNPMDADAALNETNNEDASAARNEIEAAGFNERLVAYVIDALPFVIFCYWTLSLFSNMDLIKYNSANELKWKVLWIGLYLLYETILSSGPRATVGKYLLGLRVRSKDGAYLSLGKAFFRSLGYFASSFVLNIGFLMALWTRNRRALHDFIGASRVVRIRPKKAVSDVIITVLAWGMLAFFIGSWTYQNILKVSPYERRQIVAARRSLLQIGKLEERHKRIYGRYTNDIKRLVRLSENPSFVKKSLLKSTDPTTIEIASNGRDYIVSAKAKNWRKTKVTISSLSR